MPSETAAVLRHVLQRMRARDPKYDALRRALRAAIVLPVAAAVSFAVAGGSQTPLFTIFGSVALLILVMRYIDLYWLVGEQLLART